MRFTISAEQHKLFFQKGYLELAEVISAEEAKRLVMAMDNLRSKTPGYPEENCFRSIPLIVELTKKRGWGHLASELIHKKPLKIAYDKFWSALPVVEKTWDDKDSCGLMINLATHQGTFLKSGSSESKYPPSQEGYLFILFTSSHLPEELNPTVVR